MPTTFQCYKFGTSLGVQWLRLCPSNAGGSVLSLVWELRVFPGGSDGKESARNVEDLGLIPELERSPAEGNGNHSSILAYNSHKISHAMWHAK